MSFSSELLDDCYLEKLRRWFPTVVFTHEYNPGKYVMPEEYSNIVQALLDFEVRKDDVWVVSYPRTGSTWLQEAVWLIVNDLNYDLARSKAQVERAPNIEFSGFKHDMWGVESITLDYVHNLPSPRCVKTHAPYALIPKQIHTVKPKIVYATRNPKDVWCSWYNFLKTFYRMEAPFDEATEIFLQDKMPFGGFFPHCLAYWDKRHDSNVHFVKYEDRLADDKKALKDLAEFLEKPLTEEQLDKLHDFVLFDKMKEYSSLNSRAVYDVMTPDKDVRKPFLRKGKMGDWKDHMSKEMSEMFDAWIEKNTVGTDLTFDYE